MSDDIVVSGGAERHPLGWGPIAAMFLVGLAIVFGMASIAPDGEHGPAETVTATAGAEPAADDHAGTTAVPIPNGPTPLPPPPGSRAGGPTPSTGGSGTTAGAADVGAPKAKGELSGTATFTMLSGQCPGPKTFEEDLDVHLGDGQVEVTRARAQEKVKGPLASNGTFYAASADGLVRYDGKVGAKAMSAVYRQLVENCLAQYQVDVDF